MISFCITERTDISLSVGNPQCRGAEYGPRPSLVDLLVIYMSIHSQQAFFSFTKKRKKSNAKWSSRFFHCIQGILILIRNKNIGHFLPLPIELLRLMTGKRRGQGWTKKRKSFGRRRLERSEFASFCKTAEEDIIFILFSHPKAGSKQDIQSSTVTRDGHLQMEILPTTLWCLS